MSTPTDLAYDIAVSFSREHRGYVKRTVIAAKQQGLRVFFDEDMTNEWWGRNFIIEQRRVYGARTRYFVPFLSAEYLTNPIPMDEFLAAMMTAIERRDGYILPVLIGNVIVPPDLLPKSIGYLRAEQYTPEALATELHAKVSGDRKSQEIGALLTGLAMPRVVPPTFDKRHELRTAFDYLAKRFNQAGHDLTRLGFVCSVVGATERIVVRIEHNGRLVYSLDISTGDRGMGNDKITFGPGDGKGRTGGISAWAEPRFDPAAQLPKLHVMNFSLLPDHTHRTQILTGEEFFELLWNSIIAILEGR